VIRVGLAGYGLAGSVFHAPLIRATRAMELSAIWTSRDVPNRVDSFDALLEVSDLIVIATPNATHFELAAAALNAGKHVVADKPLAVTVEQADALIELAHSFRRLLTVFHNRRWDGDFLTVRTILPELGEVSLFEASWDRFRPQVKDGWRETGEVGGGVLNDLGPHLIDQCLSLFGMPDAIAADVIAQRPEALVDDYFELRLDYGRHRAVLRSSTLIAEPRPRFAVHGTGGSFVKHGLDPQEAQLRAGMDPRAGEFAIDPRAGFLTRPDGSTAQVPGERGTWRVFYDAVAAAILDAAPVPVDPADARDGLLLIDLARRAAATGQRLEVPAASSPAGSTREA
jgi:scyllo-inositol 2-dehydrogenase (NADP+)